MVYRDDPAAGASSVDLEAVAIAELVARVKRVRTSVIAGLIVWSLFLGVGLYDSLRTWQLERRGLHSPYVTGMIAFVPTLGAALRFAPHVARWVVRRLTPGWRR